VAWQCIAFERKEGIALIVKIIKSFSHQLYGAVQGAFYNDCYVLNTSSFCWHRLPGVGGNLAGRHRHACSFAGGRVIVHGGSNGSHVYDNLFSISFSFGRDFNRCLSEPKLCMTNLTMLVCFWTNGP
jgi:hypothetical protein